VKDKLKIIFCHSHELSTRASPEALQKLGNLFGQDISIVESSMPADDYAKLQ
jgi:hypothetical protein